MSPGFKPKFDLSKKEKNGIIVLVILAFCLLGVDLILKPGNGIGRQYDYSEFDQQVKAFEKQIAQSQAKEPVKKSHENANGFTEINLANVEPFDPNQANREKWKECGLSDNQINTIMNYRKAGGFFDKKEDLKKIYGIDEAFYKRIKHLIQIKKRETQLEVKSDKKENSKTVKTPVESSKLLVGKRKVNLNSADTIELMLIHGIGRAYANRIVKYREMLGGYIKIEQLNEVYGINDSIYQSINGSFYLNNSDDTDLIKININKADFKQLIRHPYINQYQTKSILKYREIKGRIEQIEELVEYNILPEKTYNKLKGYLTCD